MNVMAEAHKQTRFILSTGVNASYRVVFKASLITAHKEYKAMSEADKLKALTIAQFEEQIIELNEAGAQYGKKWIVVCGNDHPLPVNFDSKDPKWPWAKIPDATMWSTERAAQLQAKNIRNGNGEFGRVMLVDDYIAWDVAQLQKLIDKMKGE